ncbi:tetratricopeptide repeat protein [Ochrovirga pacifica]|uniref:tetratricopeptide repeat protein n=1 Tax=Ochrovirga pacifica TaxID=1042376 RepID=UPI0002558B39|nr:hypothetical protein [Ochrovirga pacifica]
MRFWIKYLYLLIIITPTSILSQNSLDSTSFEIDNFHHDRYIMLQAPTDEAYSYFENIGKYFLSRSDTVNYLNSVVHISDIEYRKGKFNNAFELLWEVMPMANNISNKMPLLEIHQMLGILYGVYNKENEALFHLKEGLIIANKYAKIDKKYKERLTACYLDVAVQYFTMHDYNSALKYLDTCYKSDNSGNRLYFVDGVYGQVYIKLKEYNKAKKKLYGVLEYLEKNGNGFQASVAYYLGELKSAINEPDSAFVYYNKSLNAIDSLQTQTKMKPLVLEKIAKLYAKENKHKKAFNYIQKSKAWSDSLFNIQSQQNKNLFEIKNKYKDDIQKKEEQIATQTKLLELNNKAKFRLWLLIIFLLLLASIVYITFRLKVKIKKIAFEKKINDDKNKAILNVKNKELTANALQIIEKEQFTKELLEELKTKSPVTYKSLHNKHKQNNKRIWEDFHLRFTQINKNFYDQLLMDYPDLTPTDLKHCALVKLNFDSKEMSHLLGISINSVHMARSRIRKKLGLNRDDNLNIFLNKIV